MKGENTMKYTVNILNLPKEPWEGYVVARLDNTDLWYYGTYKTPKRAVEVAKALVNGVVVVAKDE